MGWYVDAQRKVVFVRMTQYDQLKKLVGHRVISALAKAGYYEDLKKALGERMVTASLERADPHVDPSLITKLRGIGKGVARDISVVQVDLSGSTSLTASVGADKAAAVLNAFIVAVATVTYDGGGAVDKYPGDAVMSFFGVNADADMNKNVRSRSVMAACRAVAVVKDVVNPALLECGLPSVKCKAGVAYSKCLIACVGVDEHNEIVAIGDAPNFAAKLEKHASPMQVLVEATALGKCYDPVKKHAQTQGETNGIKYAPVDWRAVAALQY